jgi:hypothetical protein
MTTIDELLTLDKAGLMRALEAGHPIDPHTLDDTEYRGISLGLPSTIEKLSWKTFKKVFHRDPRTGALRGWNVRIQQTGDLHGDYVPMMRRGRPHTFGHYEVVDAAEHTMPCRVDGLLIHYGLGKNAPLDPIRRVRDPLVALETGSAELLLGWSYVDLGMTTVGTPSFFVLKRDVPLTHVA